jgi:cytidine deaminase
MSELSEELQALCQSSLDARQFSYSPYSKFKVGAALVITCDLNKQLFSCINEYLHMYVHMLNFISIAGFSALFETHNVGTS